MSSTCIYCPSCPPLLLQGFPPLTSHQQETFFKDMVSRPNWLTHMSSNSFPNRIGEKIVGFYVSSLKRINAQGSVCLWVVYNFQKKNKNKKTNKGRRQRQINIKILKNLFKKKNLKKKKKKSLELNPPDLTLTYLTTTTGSRNECM